jgi:hypothetical protein
MITTLSELSYTIIKLSQFATNPAVIYYDRVDEHVSKENLHTLYGYSDADWAMDIRHRRSISRMVFFLAGAVVAWETHVQPTIALSTATSEFLATSNTGILGLFIHAVLDELLQHQREATTVYEDNDACLMVAD